MNSDKSLLSLTKYIQNQLVPSADEDEDEHAKLATLIPTSSIEQATQKAMVRRNYGLDAPCDGLRVPAALSVWRWEVTEEHWDWLPASAREKAKTRRAERLKVDYLYQTDYS
jgi:chromatin assembly factor 1 subunit A